AQAAAETAERRLRRLGAGLSASGPAGLARFVAPDPAAVPVEIRVLGGFQVLRDGVAAPLGAWQSRKARDLLKILVTRRGRPISREVLGETLWPEDESEAVAGRLSVALSTLRSVLDPDRRFPADHFVAADASAVSLRSENVRVDVDVFFASVDAALAATGDDARDLLEAAEAAYAGELLEEDPHAEWAVALRERARAAYVRVTHALAALVARGGDHQEAVDLLLRVLERDPYDERAHRGLVAALQAEGRHGEARRAHAAYTSRMAEIGAKASAFPAPS
ncbi:MAG: AfsR/SARP family transcriptional regulator, partial [Candidatus Limnocylindria bacterium]